MTPPTPRMTADSPGAEESRAGVRSATALSGDVGLGDAGGADVGSGVGDGGDEGRADGGPAEGGGGNGGRGTADDVD